MENADRTGPRLVVLCGLPGVGKTTVGELIVGRLDDTGSGGGRLLRTDTVRKELFDQPRYTDAETEEVYGTLFERARETVESGRWAVLDGTFRDRSLRERAVAVAEKTDVLATFVKVICEESVAVERIRNRTDDESDAEVEDYDHFREIFDCLERRHATVDNSGTREETREQVVDLF